MDFKQLEENKKNIDSLYISLYNTRNKVFLQDAKSNLIKYLQKLSYEDYYLSLFHFGDYFANIHYGNGTQKSKIFKELYNPYKNKKIKFTDEYKINADRFAIETHCYSFLKYPNIKTYLEKYDSDFEFELEKYYINLAKEFLEISYSDISTELENQLKESLSEIETEKQNIQTIIENLEKDVSKDIVLINNLKKEISNIFTGEQLSEYKTNLNNIIKKENEDLRNIINSFVYMGLAK